MLDKIYTKVTLVTSHRKWYVATKCHDTKEGGKGSSFAGRRACDFHHTCCGRPDTILVNNNSDRAVLRTLANNNKGKESSARNVEILMTHLVNDIL
jgi:hypothetical protein